MKQSGLDLGGFMSGGLFKSLGLLLLCAMLLAFGPQRLQAAEPSRERLTATVVEFSVRGDLDEQAGAIIADLMMSAIANSGRFTLKDRLPLTAAAKIAKAQELGSTGLLDPKTAAELGRLYGVDALVTGGVSKLGDLITVTARLIDTKTASLLASGQIQDKDIDAIQIKVNDLAGMVLVSPPSPQTYAVNIKNDPADATVRLLTAATPYQPGMRLAPGNYEFEVSKPGYVTRKESLQISDHDVVAEIKLEKMRYGLTVRPDPPDARIQLLGVSTPYQPGVALLPGDYQIEVAREGYVSRKLPVRIVDSEVSVPIMLEKVAPPPRQYRLTIQPDPPQAKIRLLNVKTAYQPGVALPPGRYTVDVSQAAYDSTQQTIVITDSDVVTPIKLVKKPELPPPPLYQLTVRADPSDAKVKLLGVKTAYKSGVSLPPGHYTVDVSRTGYESKRTTIQITDSDQTVAISLVKQPEPPPPPEYQLTVRAEPPDARIRLRGTRTTYQPGVLLAPGSYTVEVSRTGYETKQLPIRMADSDQTVSVVLVKAPEPVQPTEYRLTVQPEPTDARVRLRGSRIVYRPGVLLAPGSYNVEVSRTGYETKQIAVRIADSDQTVPVALVKEAELEQPTQYRLTVRTEPTEARVRLVNSSYTYRPGILLPPGSYTLEVGERGYQPKRLTIRMTNSDLSVPVILDKTASTMATPSSSVAAPSRAGEWRIGSVQVDGSVGGVDRSEVSRVLNAYIGRTVTRDTLLDGALRVYQTTGITLSFAVRSSSSGAAELYARVVRQTRRTYETTVSIMTRSQLEKSGFGVSVE